MDHAFDAPDLADDPTRPPPRTPQRRHPNGQPVRAHGADAWEIGPDHQGLAQRIRDQLAVFETARPGEIATALGASMATVIRLLRALQKKDEVESHDGLWSLRTATTHAIDGVSLRRRADGCVTVSYGIHSQCLYPSQATPEGIERARLKVRARAEGRR